MLHPVKEDVDNAMASPPPSDPNALASPLLVEWKEARIILGSDLPKKGWKRLSRNNTELRLGTHHALKIAHHGSKGALHEAVLTGAETGRCWLMTPFHRGRGLPCFDDDHGIAGLLEYNREVIVTSLRDVVATDGARPARLTRQRIRDDRAAASRKSALGAEVRRTPRQGKDPGGWVAVGFSGTGTIEDIQYGDGAAIIVDDPNAKPATTRKKRSRKSSS